MKRTFWFEPLVSFVMGGRWCRRRSIYSNTGEGCWQWLARVEVEDRWWWLGLFEFFYFLIYFGKLSKKRLKIIFEFNRCVYGKFLSVDYRWSKKNGTEDLDSKDAWLLLWNCVMFLRPTKKHVVERRFTQKRKKKLKKKKKYQFISFGS